MNMFFYLGHRPHRPRQERGDRVHRADRRRRGDDPDRAATPPPSALAVVGVVVLGGVELDGNAARPAVHPRRVGDVGGLHRRRVARRPARPRRRRARRRAGDRRRRRSRRSARRAAGRCGRRPRCSSPASLVGVFSNAIGYGIDQHVLRRIPVRRFSVLLALLPVTARRRRLDRARPAAVGARPRSASPSCSPASCSRSATSSPPRSPRPSRRERSRPVADRRRRPALTFYPAVQHLLAEGGDGRQPVECIDLIEFDDRCRACRTGAGHAGRAVHRASRGRGGRSGRITTRPPSIVTLIPRSTSAVARQ